jgi:hypothetical protein
MLPLAKRLVRLSRARRRSQSSSSTDTNQDDAFTAGHAHLAAITEDYGHFRAGRDENGQSETRLARPSRPTH